MENEISTTKIKSKKKWNYLLLSSLSLSLNSIDVPVLMLTDESVSTSICNESLCALDRSLDTDTLLDCTIEIAFDAIEMDTELEKCKHLRITFATNKRIVEEKIKEQMHELFLNFKLLWFTLPSFKNVLVNIMRNDFYKIKKKNTLSKLKDKKKMSIISLLLVLL